MNRTRASGLVAALLLLALGATTPLGSGYGNDQGLVLDNATTCGDASGCHGLASPQVNLTLEGPVELEVGQVGWYNATLVGGPAQAYGFYIVVTNSNGISKTIDGDFLVPVTSDQASNVTHDTPLPSNRVSFNLTAPKYAGKFIINVAFNSVDGDGLNSTGDVWAAQTYEIQVVYPHEVVHWRTFYLGLAALAFVGVTTLYFRSLKLKLGA